MRPWLCLLLLLGAAADDRVVLRRGDAAPVSVPPLEPGTRRALRRGRRGAAAARTRGPRGGARAAPGRRGAAAARTRGPRGVPAPPRTSRCRRGGGRADRGRSQRRRAGPRRPRRRRDLQASDDDDACQYVSVSGTTGQTGREGTYDASASAARPYYGVWTAAPATPVHLYTGSQWFIGPGGCGATVAGIYINDAAGTSRPRRGTGPRRPSRRRTRRSPSSASRRPSADAAAKSPTTTTCQYVSVSGTTGQTSREGTYERVGECAARPYYECLDCSASDPRSSGTRGPSGLSGPRLRRDRRRHLY